MKATFVKVGSVGKMDNRLIVSGKTFNRRKELGSYGFVWDPRRKFWHRQLDKIALNYLECIRCWPELHISRQAVEDIEKSIEKETFKAKDLRCRALSGLNRPHANRADYLKARAKYEELMAGDLPEPHTMEVEEINLSIKPVVPNKGFSVEA
jgi:hypothetical protein